MVAGIILTGSIDERLDMLLMTDFVKDMYGEVGNASIEDNDDCSFFFWCRDRRLVPLSQATR